MGTMAAIISSPVRSAVSRLTVATISLVGIALIGATAAPTTAKCDRHSKAAAAMLQVTSGGMESINQTNTTESSELQSAAQISIQKMAKLRRMNQDPFVDGWKIFVG